MLDKSVRVRANQMQEEWYLQRIKELGYEFKYKRKQWEHAVIAQVFEESETSSLESTPRVLGFGIGREPLPAWFAGRGCEVIATDWPPSEKVWKEYNAGSKIDIPYEGICSPAQYLDIDYRAVNMNDIPDDLVGQFDFTWSSGSFEHIGSMEKAMRFYCNQMRCLKPGGIAAHTTEFNFGKQLKTIDGENLVLFRERDLNELVDRIIIQGDMMWPLDLVQGLHMADIYIDESAGVIEHEYHLNVKVGVFPTTSVLLVAQKSIL